MERTILTVLVCAFFALSPEIPLLAQRCFGIQSALPTITTMIVLCLSAVVLYLSFKGSQIEKISWPSRLCIMAIMVGAGLGLGSSIVALSIAHPSKEAKFLGTYLVWVLDAFMTGTIVLQAWCSWKQPKDPDPDTVFETN